MNSLQGKLLVAIPQLADPNFFRSVVLILHHDDEGASGLVLNRPSNVLLREAFPSLAPADRRVIAIGGPVEGPLMALHDWAEQGEQVVFSNVYWSMQRDCIERFLRQAFPINEPVQTNLSDSGAGTTKGVRVRFFSGYAGWGSGQLDDELAVGGWLVTPASAAIVFGDPDSTWDDACRMVGRDVLSSSKGLQHFLADPSCN